MPKDSPKPPKARKPPSEKKADIWARFETRVRAAADEVGVPLASFELKKTRAAFNKKSEAWKDFEREVKDVALAAGFLAKRVSRGADLGESDIDVDIEDLPHVKVDTKYKLDGWTHHTIFEGCEEKYLEEPGDFLVMPTKAGGTAGSLTTVRTEVFFKLLAMAYRGERTADDHGLDCPRCARGRAVVKHQLAMGFIELECPECRLAFLMREADVPEFVLHVDTAQELVLFPVTAQPAERVTA